MKQHPALQLFKGKKWREIRVFIKKRLGQHDRAMKAALAHPWYGFDLKIQLPSFEEIERNVQL